MLSVTGVFVKHYPIDKQLAYFQIKVGKVANPTFFRQGSHARAPRQMSEIFANARG